jgi:hypothetical protein
LDSKVFVRGIHVLFSLLGTFNSWGSTLLDGLLRAWEIFWNSEASVAFMAGACFVLILILIIGIAERGAESDMVQYLIAAGYVPQAPAQAPQSVQTQANAVQQTPPPPAEVQEQLVEAPQQVEPVPVEVPEPVAAQKGKKKAEKIIAKSEPLEKPVEAPVPQGAEVNIEIPIKPQDIPDEEPGVLDKVKSLPVKIKHIINPTEA